MRISKIHPNLTSCTFTIKKSTGKKKIKVILEHYRNRKKGTEKQHRLGIATRFRMNLNIHFNPSKTVSFN